MREGAAFRFIGRMGSDIAKASAVAINTGTNPIYAALSTGTQLLDCVGSIMSLCNEKQKTAIILHSSIKSKALMDTLESEKRVLNEIEVQQSIKMQAKEINQYRIVRQSMADAVIQCSKNEMRIRLENIRIDENKAKYNLKRKALYDKNRQTESHQIIDILQDNYSIAEETYKFLEQNSKGNRQKLKELSVLATSADKALSQLRKIILKSV